jgi:hypothetical protein
MRASKNIDDMRGLAKENEAAAMACKLRPLAAPASRLAGCPGVSCHFQILPVVFV